MRSKPFFLPAAVCLMGMAWLSGAGATDIAGAPLITSSPNAVLPNLVFVLDDSGSMNWDYMPDWVNDDYCRASGATSTNSGTFDAGCTGQPPFLSSAFNGVYYNPAVVYRPPINASGTALTSQTSANTSGWTSVRNDAYQIQSTSSTNLLTGYPDTAWCTDTSYTDCLRNGNYVLPGTVGGKSYTVRRSTSATGSGFLAIGAPDAPTASASSSAFGPHYYTMVAGEYCDKPNLRNCQATQTSTFKYAAPLRWCTTDANARAAAPAAGTCQAQQTATYVSPRFPTKFFTTGTSAIPGTSAVAASTTFSISLSGCNNSKQVALSAVTVNGTLNLLGSSTSLERRENNLATEIADGINARTGTTGYSANANSNSVTITAPVSVGNISYPVTFTRTTTSHNSCVSTFSPNTIQFSGYVAATPGTPGVPAGYPGSFARTDIVASRSSYPKAATRNDCAGTTTCTYAEEMTNFANWWTYYHTRMQSMKSSASLAFGTVSDQYRVGYMSINNNTGSDFLNLDTFTDSGSTTQRTLWYQKLVAAKPNNSTPLRTALSTVGRLYGGRLNDQTLNGSTVRDPVQYSCQQNFTLLSTDGFWNESSSPKQLDGSTAIGDADGALARPQLDGNNTLNTLADVAAYYYETDLRTSGATCTSATGVDLCENNVRVGSVDVAQHQHMTSFTLGLGASGSMQFRSDYLSAKEGDYFDVKYGNTANPTNGICTWQTGGACNWPAPTSNQLTTIDDLWHAAINGRGTYFSATDPSSIYNGLSSALSTIGGEIGAAAAATTSNPNVTSGDNLVFISKFKTEEWSGELLGQQINIETGALMAGSSWSAQALLDTNSSRSIYLFDASNATTGRKSFEWANLSTTERSHFESAHITATGASLSQFCSSGPTCLSSGDQTTAAGEKLVDFLRGVRTDEGTLTDASKYFRQRTHLLGDIVNSEAVYVKRPLLHYVDAGFSSYKTTAPVSTRQGMVYVGANDGMLHAFSATSGAEVWSYIPTMVLPNLYKLADKDYKNRHQFFVDSTPTVADAYIGGAWRTLLVGGLGAGGRGYYALDVTDPTQPKPLWEFSDNNLGLSFGRPEITKLKDGTWVVIAASGYNNVSPGDGHGRLFVLNAASGALIRSIDTGEGSTSSASGLANIRAYVDSADLDNTALRVYGGDTLGNVWRFDINNDIGASGYDAQLLATLRRADGTAQPVTSRLELASVSGSPFVYVGTGRYLGITDLADSKTQSIYGIKDTLGSTSYGSPRLDTRFIRQTLTDSTCPSGATICSPTQAVRLGSNNPVNPATDAGWYVDLPASYERANTDPQLALGTLVFTTNIVDPSACDVGGRSYINFFDYRTGGSVSTATGVSSVLLGNAIATRPAVVRLPNGNVVSLTRLSDDRTITSPVPIGTTSTTTRRVSWRELPSDK
jgi:type IV pilus assembly protein PilY1